MAEPYLSDLQRLTVRWSEADSRIGELECRHFFSGAAAHRDGAIVASLTPVGLAFKVPSEIRDELLAEGSATPLRYFPNAPVKRDYVLFPTPVDVSASDAVRLLRGDTLDDR